MHTERQKENERDQNWKGGFLHAANSSLVALVALSRPKLNEHCRLSTTTITTTTIVNLTMFDVRVSIYLCFNHQLPTTSMCYVRMGYVDLSSHDCKTRLYFAPVAERGTNRMVSVGRQNSLYIVEKSSEAARRRDNDAKTATTCTRANRFGVKVGPHLRTIDN